MLGESLPHVNKGGEVCGCGRVSVDVGVQSLHCRLSVFVQTCVWYGARS